MQKNIDEWVGSIIMPPQLAKTEAKDVFAAQTESLQCTWNYHQRLVPNCSAPLKCLNDELLLNPLLPKVYELASEDARRLLLRNLDPVKQAE